MAMIPLSKSWAVDEAEDELRNLAIAIYSETLKEKADEINVYGAPHIGPFSLVERAIARDGLTVLRTTDSDAIRHLFLAWRFRNPKRGFHFLKVYLRVLFGDVSTVNQMWQKTSEPYPTALKTREEISFSGDSESDYFLTSRVAVDIDTEIVPITVVQSLKTTVAARFVLDVRVAKFQQNEIGLAQNIGGGVLCFGSGEMEASSYPGYRTTESGMFRVTDTGEIRVIT